MKAWLPAPSVFAWIVTGAGPALTAPFSVTAFAELSSTPPASVVPATLEMVPRSRSAVFVVTVMRPPVPC